MGKKLNNYPSKDVALMLNELFLSPKATSLLFCDSFTPTIIPYSSTTSLSVTSTTVKQDLDFILNKISPEDLGSKSLTLNLAEQAAMGATPLYYFISISLPLSITDEWSNGFFEGLTKTADSANLTFMGGVSELTTAPLSISVVTVGEIPTSIEKSLNNLSEGDVICVTDYLGDAALAKEFDTEKINILELSDKIYEMIFDILSIKYHHPHAQLEEGQWLAKQSGVTVLRNLSKGAYHEIKKLADHFKLGAEIDLDMIPLSKELIRVCDPLKKIPSTVGLLSGDDICLLVTISADKFQEVNRAFEEKFRRSLFPIGIFKPKENGVRYFRDKKPFQIYLENNHT